jgi:membrane protein DedA with SNARE-associated domain
MEQARHFLTQFNGPGSYAILYFTLLCSSLGIPLNSDLILITVSALAAFGAFKLPILIPIAFLGLLSGDSINFFFARKYGPSLLGRAPFRWVLTENRISLATAFLRKYGSGFVFCIRFLPFIRPSLFFTAGSLQIKPRTFYLLNSASTLLYLSILMNAAHSAAENQDILIAGFKKFQLVPVAILAAGMILILGMRLKKRLKSG